MNDGSRAVLSYWFDTTAAPDLRAVGGKALSLTRLTGAGLAVPSGFVLTVAFFEPWIATLQATPEWQTLQSVLRDGGDLTAASAALKSACERLTYTPKQEQALTEGLGVLPDGALLAVRSSSPEEDLAGASFAGGYETTLGVTGATVHDAIRRSFSSVFDERVFAYKQQHGFPVEQPRIAVIAQQLVDAQCAGVGFSLNPVTNDFDEAVIDASWGLGESVVAGLVSPDHFVVDKVTRTVVERQRGVKETSIWLDPDGGTIEREGYRSDDVTLDDAHLDQLTDLLRRIEGLFGTPVDIEWAYADGRLHVLQARPITTFVPLTPEMVTPPGERRRLYMDGALSKGLTINAPISPMGLDWMAYIYLGLIERFTGASSGDMPLDEAPWFFAGGRMYISFSNMLWLTDPKKFAKNTAQTDVLMAAIIDNIDSERYRAPSKPKWARIRMVRYVPRVLWRLRGLFWAMLRTLAAPGRAHATYLRAVDDYETEVLENLDYSQPLDAFVRVNYPTLMGTFETSMASLMAAVVALATVDLVVGGVADDGPDNLGEKLKMGFEGNVVIEMGIGLHRLAGLLDPADYEDLDRLSDRVARRKVPADFLEAWDAFLARFGGRGPAEMDLASPRYADDPALALRQMSYLGGSAGGFDPEAAHAGNVRARQEAYETLMARSGWLRRRLLGRIYRIIDLFAGTRDTPKHQVVMYNYAVRRRALIEGQRLVEAGRIDDASQVFDLTLGDIAAAGLDPGMDLRAVRAERRRFLDVLAAQVKSFPHVIDSRGRILRPAPREETPGELRGMPASPGIVSGTVKVLTDPGEKRIEPGDVLVAYTTDPGWTPLFLNAAAVVLQVGGVLQHGAVVAREYGKPCVIGIDRLMTRLQDGQTVEVDGTEGVIRLEP